jgi:hypothetical protein
VVITPFDSSGGFAGANVQLRFPTNVTPVGATVNSARVVVRSAVRRCSSALPTGGTPSAGPTRKFRWVRRHSEE